MAERKDKNSVRSLSRVQYNDGSTPIAGFDDKPHGWYYWHNATWYGPFNTRRETRELLRHEKLIPQSHLGRMAGG